MFDCWLDCICVLRICTSKNKADQLFLDLTIICVNLWLTDCIILLLNTSRPRQDGYHFADYIFKSIFLYENIVILVDILLKFVPIDTINDNTELLQIMVWRRTRDKPLSKPMVVYFTDATHICTTRPQWVNWCNVFQNMWLVPII